MDKDNFTLESIKSLIDAYVGDKGYNGLYGIKRTYKYTYINDGSDKLYLRLEIDNDKGLPVVEYMLNLSTAKEIMRFLNQVILGDDIER